MKVGVPFLNYFLAFAYIFTAGFILLLLKLALRKGKVSKLSGKKEELIFNEKMEEYISLKMVAVSWFKKYTIASAVVMDDPKYSLKECFILSVFSVACFGINKVVLWPVTFSLFLLPLTVFMF